MPQTSLLTKLFIPQPRPNLVPRPRWLEQVAAGMAGPLTLISAPAGNGKTALIAEWRDGPGAEEPATRQIHRQWIYTRWPRRFRRATHKHA